MSDAPSDAATRRSPKRMRKERRRPHGHDCRGRSFTPFAIFPICRHLWKNIKQVIELDGKRSRWLIAGPGKREVGSPP
jgi:hypothetical protein